MGEWTRGSAMEAEPLCLRRVRPLMFVAEIRDLSETESRRGGGRMDTSVRNGGRTTLPPLHSAANVSSEDWEE